MFWSPRQVQSSPTWGTFRALPIKYRPIAPLTLYLSVCLLFDAAHQSTILVTLAHFTALATNPIFIFVFYRHEMLGSPTVWMHFHRCRSLVLFSTVLYCAVLSVTVLFFGDVLVSTVLVFGAVHNVQCAQYAQCAHARPPGPCISHAPAW